MDQIITYDKSLQERLQEYRKVFGCSPSIWHLKEQLSAYLELGMDHSGWQAIWKIPRITCESLKIPFPTIVLVYVDNVHYIKQVADITVLIKQDHVDIPETHTVPLAQLWLTKEQDKTVGLNLESTGNALDVLNFFYANLYLPWDDDDLNWVEVHLEQRLRLFYDTKNGVMPKCMAERLKSLLTQAKKLHVKCLELQDVIQDQEHNEKFEQYLELQVQIMEIQKEIELLENPLSRKVLIKRQKVLEEIEKKTEKTFWIAFNESTFDDCVLFWQQLKALYPNETFKTALNLKTALDKCDDVDVIVINSGTHKIKDSGCMETGGTLKCVGKKSAVIISTNENIMLDLSGSVTIENVTLDASYSQCAILVRNGNVVLKNCTIIGDNYSTTHQGFIVLKGSSLELIDCCVRGFGTAIVGNSKANVKLHKCEIYSCGYGFKIHDDCIVELLNCSFHDCKEYAVLVETDRKFYVNNGRVGDFSILRR